MEHPLITAVTHSTGEARVTLKGVPDTPGIAGRVTTALAEANVNIDMIIQNEPVSEGAPRRHVVHRARATTSRSAQATLAPIAEELGIEVATDESMGKVSIVGAGMKTHPGVAAKVFTTLGENGINIEMISTSPDPHLLRRAGRPRARRGPRAAQARSTSRARTRSAPRSRSGRSA